MAANRNDKLISEAAELRADNATQRARIMQLEELLEKQNDVVALDTTLIAELRAELSRKERVINMYAAQLKQARKKVAEQATPSDRRAAMARAKAEAMATGRTVAV